MKEVKKLLTPEGKVIFVDFEKPWNRKSRLGSLLISSIERMAGGEHYKNSRQFLKDGGLQRFVNSNGLRSIERHNIALANSSIVVAQFKSLF